MKPPTPAIRAKSQQTRAKQINVSMEQRALRRPTTATTTALVRLDLLAGTAMRTSTSARPIRVEMEPPASTPTEVTNANARRVSRAEIVLSIPMTVFRIPASMAALVSTASASSDVSALTGLEVIFAKTISTNVLRIPVSMVPLVMTTSTLTRKILDL